MSKMILPGDQTGLYHLVVAGLPWQCSWAKLKDFVINISDPALNVDYVEVYPGSTDGLVRFTNKEDFNVALGVLQGAVLDGRSLIVDGRNATQPLPLRENAVESNRRRRNDSVQSFQSCSSDYDPSMTQYPIHKSISEWQYQLQAMAGTYTPVSPVVSSDGYFQPRVPTYEAPPTQFVAPPTPQYYTHPPSVVFAGNIPPSTPVYVPQQQVLSYIVPQIPFATAPAPAPNLVVPFQPANPGSSSIVKTEARKIIITQLPHNISKSELCYMLEKAGFESRSTSQRNHVQEIELARHSDGASKRHAFVVLESHHYAKRAVEALNGIKFQGRKLQLRLAKEGAEPSQRRSPPAQSSGYHVSRTASPHMLPLSASMGNLTIRTESNSTGSNHGVTEEHVATRNARSSGSKGSSKSTKDEGKKERESSRKYDSQSGGSDASATPVVVDGSSCAKKQRKHH